MTWELTKGCLIPLRQAILIQFTCIMKWSQNAGFPFITHRYWASESGYRTANLLPNTLHGELVFLLEVGRSCQGLVSERAPYNSLLREWRSEALCITRQIGLYSWIPKLNIAVRRLKWLLPSCKQKKFSSNLTRLKDRCISRLILKSSTVWGSRR